MQRRPPRSDARTETGRDLARTLYDYKLGDLVRLSGAERDKLRARYPTLEEPEFQDVLDQVIAAKRYQQELTGWLAVPHDVAVLVFVILTCLVNLRVGAVVGVGVLVLLESLFQVVFDRQLYRVLSFAVWLTYPAYLLLAYVLYQRGYALVWILVILLAAWVGSFVLGILARIPLHLILEARAQGTAEAARRKKK